MILALGGIDTLQLDYSLLNRQPERDALPYCQEHHIGVIVRGPLAMGKLSGKFTPETTFPEGDICRGWLERIVSPSCVTSIWSIDFAF